MGRRPLRYVGRKKYEPVDLTLIHNRYFNPRELSNVLRNLGAPVYFYDFMYLAQVGSIHPPCCQEPGCLPLWSYEKARIAIEEICTLKKVPDYFNVIEMDTYMAIEKEVARLKKESRVNKLRLYTQRLREKRERDKKNEEKN